jgi:hypothetical protein
LRQSVEAPRFDETITKDELMLLMDFSFSHLFKEA